MEYLQDISCEELDQLLRALDKAIIAMTLQMTPERDIDTIQRLRKALDKYTAMRFSDTLLTASLKG